MEMFHCRRPVERCAARVDELPPVERRALIAALTQSAKVAQS
jgi:hypothetical protein